MFSFLLPHTQHIAYLTNLLMQLEIIFPENSSFLLNETEVRLKIVFELCCFISLILIILFLLCFFCLT